MLAPFVMPPSSHTLAIRCAALLVVTAAGTPPGSAETLRVGPGGPLRLPSQAAAVARDGDRVVIAPGRYRDCATWRAAGLRIEAAEGGEVEISGPVCGGKALFVAAAPGITVAGLTFVGATTAEGNGAGIRAEGGDLRVLRSRFLGNQNGILTAAMPQATLVVEDSTFVGNGAQLGDCAHGLYAGRLASVIVRRSRFENTRACHHVKSRAARTEVVDSVIADGPDGEASYLVDVPNGGDLLLARNEMRKGPRSGNPRVAVMIGAEGVTWPTNSLRVQGNRFTNAQERRTIFVENRSDTPAELEGNTLSGRVVALVGAGQAR